ncbi:MAG TPA: bifunctional riboflavin kinase/FAD synthetase [Candidatus Angelobacter sp.]|nr:bifunctional riboflavin kinase/FAD synthetase [Candidatus Angelobacter sp.]
MRIFRTLQEVPADLGPSIVTVGNFDGVHCGHRQVLQEVVRRAGESHARAVAVTFQPHPLQILRPQAAPRLITPPGRKEALLAQTGLDALVVIPFSLEFSRTTPAEFARNILAGKLRAIEVHEGENFHFGHKARGTTAQLSELGGEFGFSVKSYPVMMLRGCPVSSSEVRRLLSAGQVSRARHLLGRVFNIVAGVERGRGYGHKYTVPTINLAQYDELVPAHGVYVTRTRIGEETFNSVTNVGTRPTFGEASFAIESHLLDFHPLDITPQTEVETSFLYWLRREIKFPSVEALKQQIGKDVKRAQRYFRLSPKPESTTETQRHGGRPR